MFTKYAILPILATHDHLTIAQLYAAFPAIPPRRILAAIEALQLDGLVDCLYLGDQISEVCLLLRVGHGVH